MALWACGSSSPTETVSPPAAPSETPTPTGAASDVLAMADETDGALDKTVSQCAGCGLGMPGDPTHAVEHEGYELQFCSETCAANFSEDPEAGVQRLETAVKGR